MKSNTQNAKIEAITEKTLVLGIDVGSETHYARAFDYRGIEYSKKPFKFSNTEAGFVIFKEWMCFVNRKSSKSEGKSPTFRSGNPHYPKETCREFSFFPLSSRKESSIHCFLPNRVIRVRLCQRLPERFAFNVLSFDSAPAPG